MVRLDMNIIETIMLVVACGLIGLGLGALTGLSFVDAWNRRRARKSIEQSPARYMVYVTRDKRHIGLRWEDKVDDKLLPNDVRYPTTPAGLEAVRRLEKNLRKRQRLEKK